MPNTTTRGACAGHPDPDLWFAQVPTKAKAICLDECPVREACLARALDVETGLVLAGRADGGEGFALRYDVLGVVGGKTAPERRSMIRGRLAAIDRIGAAA